MKSLTSFDFCSVVRIFEVDGLIKQVLLTSCLAVCGLGEGGVWMTEVVILMGVVLRWEGM